LYFVSITQHNVLSEIRFLNKIKLNLFTNGGCGELPNLNDFKLRNLAKFSAENCGS